eukprot:CAMPEP_0196665402 /NCGR_PEP_ID=MMETSP1086-20130531/60968_1 /TAXON_ID=77921 /ORGANISM="Cyanoptyche  gloeocystis , Strain SAG4.97" /LENGTH=250 /DNA_ID=CAMNT_0042002155 /DNA_START=83 /DNA_END=835 /DNA_ORIENTATION=-
MPRKFFVGGNWKCNGTLASIDKLVQLLNEGSIPSSDIVDVVVAPTYVHIPYVLPKIRKEIQVAAQDCWTESSGAYTGAVAPEMLKDIGLNWVILGHSERRHVFKESDELTAKKTAKALAAGLKVIACIGELLEERQAGKTMEVNIRQLEAYKSVIGDKWADIVIAYEPVWAIGTGVTATPDQAQEVQNDVRKWLAANVSQHVADTVRIIYGGSVTAANCKDLSKMPDIDGFLVGGASLKPDFLPIINSAT